MIYKKFCSFIFIALTCIASANASEIFAGMRNERYAFIGFKSQSNFGVALENSVLVQKPKIQYVRLAPFYVQETSIGFDIIYALYGGMRYDAEYYDIGSRISLDYSLLSGRLKFFGTFQAFYDSDIGREFTYLAGFQAFVLQEVGFNLCVKNLPEYRHPEHRVAGGLIFKTERISVMPEISTPLDGQSPLTRVSISFMYRLPI